MTALRIRMLPGERYGRLVSIRKIGGRRWAFRCDCGQIYEGKNDHVRAGSVQSCGCLRGEQHGLSKSPEYNIWCNMVSRCENTGDASYPRYGGRGIKVCERWRNSFSAFLSDIGFRPSSQHSIDRYPDQNGDYEPANCRWATDTQQARNRRSNTVISIQDVSMCLAEWCEHLSIAPAKIFEMTRPRGGKRDKPPLCSSPDDAIRFVISQRWEMAR
jgi:hypothetical protein